MPCCDFISIAVMKHPDKKQLGVYLAKNSRLQSILKEKFRQELKTAWHITSTLKSRETINAFLMPACLPSFFHSFIF